MGKCEVRNCKRERAAHVHKPGYSFWVCLHHLKRVMRGAAIRLKGD